MEIKIHPSLRKTGNGEENGLEERKKQLLFSEHPFSITDAVTAETALAYDHSVFKTDGTGRKRENCLAASSLIIDFDNEENNQNLLDDVLNRCKELGYACLIAHSKSHMKEKIGKKIKPALPRLHVYFSLENQISIEKYMEIHKYLCRQFDGVAVIDEGVKGYIVYSQMDNENKVYEFLEGKCIDAVYESEIKEKNLDKCLRPSKKSSDKEYPSEKSDSYYINLELFRNSPHGFIIRDYDDKGAIISHNSERPELHLFYITGKLYSFRSAHGLDAWQDYSKYEAAGLAVTGSINEEEGRKYHTSESGWKKHRKNDLDAWILKNLPETLDINKDELFEQIKNDFEEKGLETPTKTKVTRDLTAWGYKSTHSRYTGIRSEKRIKYLKPERLSYEEYRNKISKEQTKWFDEITTGLNRSRNQRLLSGCRVNKKIQNIESGRRRPLRGTDGRPSQLLEKTNNARSRDGVIRADSFIYKAKSSLEKTLPFQDKQAAQEANFITKTKISRRHSLVSCKH